MHRFDLEKLLETLNLEAATNEISDATLDFGGMLDLEILQKIISQDEIAADLYTELAEKTDLKFVAALSGLKNDEFFYKTLEHIVEDEKSICTW